jgi:hypothetical protein
MEANPNPTNAPNPPTMPIVPQPLLQWPSNGIVRVAEDALVLESDTIYYLREKYLGRPGKTFGPYQRLDQLKNGCKIILEHRCKDGITFEALRDFLEPLNLWQLVDIVIAPTSILAENVMPYDVIAQPNKNVAKALRDVPVGSFQTVFAVRVAVTHPPFVQKREGLDARLHELINDAKIWGISTVYLEREMAKQHASRLFNHLFRDLNGVSWFDYTNMGFDDGIFLAVILGREGEVVAIIHVKYQWAA